MTYDADMPPKTQDPQINIPLNDSQKLSLRNLQNRRLATEIQLRDIDQALQVELNTITKTNNIDGLKYQLNDALEIVPLPKA